MEHSAEKVILDKILDAEKADVSWKKEWVWTRIETPPQRKKFIFWYAAAAIVVGVIGASIYWSSANNALNMMAQLDKLELAIEQLTTATTLPAEIVEQACAEEVTTSVPKITVHKNFLSREPIQSQISETPNSNINPIINSMDEVPITIAVSIEEPEFNSVRPNKIIKPIVGKIPEEQTRVAAAKSKEFKIRVFQARNAHENSVIENREYKLLTARFNNN